MPPDLFQLATTNTAERTPFRVYVPPGEQRAGLPVILYLHGAASQGRDNLIQTQSSFARMLIEHPTRLACPVVFPQCPAETYWLGDTVRIALDALRTTVERFDADPRRLYLVGNSLGGYGAWHLLVLYPDIFAAVVTVSGGLVPTSQHEHGRHWAHAGAVAGDRCGVAAPGIGPGGGRYPRMAVSRGEGHGRTGG